MIYDSDKRLWLPGSLAPTRRSQRGAIGIMAQRMPLKPMTVPWPLLDTFTGAAGNLSGHTPEQGGAWIQTTSGGGVISLDGAGVVAADTSTNFATYYNTGTPASADYTVTITIANPGSGGGIHEIGAIGRYDTVAATSNGAAAQWGFNRLCLLSIDNIGQRTNVDTFTLPSGNFVAGDTVTIHFSGTDCWASAETAARGHVETAHHAAVHTAAGFAGIWGFAAVGDVPSATKLVSA